jgi:hypothetical protein
VDEVALEQIYLLVSSVFRANHHFTIAPYVSLTAKVWDIPDQAAHYHLLSDLKLGGSWLQSDKVLSNS